jgi:cyclopropane fatty-acyl-phospholipid synthase-like methyltransferase
MDFFNSAYRGTPPWDIGRPQKEFIGLVKRGEITGPVLDIGCGTGEHALFFAAEGHEVWAIDSAPLAIQKAKEKAAERGLRVHFLVLDALHMSELIRKSDTGRETAKQVPDQEKTAKQFSTATDSGLFHTLSDEDRPVFVENLAAVLSPGGKYLMLCFSELEPGGYGPRRVTQGEIRESFRDGWTINYIRPATFESRTRAEGPKAWLSSISRD